MIHIHCGLVESLEKETSSLKGFPSLMEKVDSVTPGKPCVQNDMKVRSKMEEQPSSLNEPSTNGTIGTALVE